MSEQKNKLASLKKKYLAKVKMIQTSVYFDDETTDKWIAYAEKHKEKKSIVLKIALLKLFADTDKN